MKNENLGKKIDFPVIIIPCVLVAVLCILFFAFPAASNAAFSVINPIFRDKLGLTYLVVNLGGFILAFYLAFSKFGNIKLGGKDEKPAHSFFSWGAMMFCCGLAGDILFYSFTEWTNYVQEPYINALGNPYHFSNAYSMFFWSNYWLYLVISVCFAFMIFVRKRNRQKFSEVLRPVLKGQTDGIIGKIIDVFSVFVIICAVTCSICFSLPVITTCLNELCGIPNTAATTIVVILIVCVLYTTSVLRGIKGINVLSKICVYVFFILLAYIFLFGGESRYILESSFKQIGVLFDNLPFMFTDIDPTRTSTFVQDYCVFYDAYWLTWVITVPYFIAIISKGMTVRQVILGGLLFAVPGGLLAFLIIPNYGMAQQLLHGVDILGIYNETGDIYNVISTTVSTLPLAKLVMAILILSMVCFCATSFDSISLSCSYYSYKNIDRNDVPSRKIRFFWAVMLSLFPIALIASHAPYDNLQNVAVLAGFPAAILFTLSVIAFIKDARKYMKEPEQNNIAENASLS